MIDSIFELNEIKQNFKPDIQNKIQYGEVNTPFSLIEEILSVIPSHFFQDTKKMVRPCLWVWLFYNGIV